MQTIIITLNNGKKEEYVKGIKVKEILNKMSKEEREDAILIKYNNKKVNLETELKKAMFMVTDKILKPTTAWTNVSISETENNLL